MTPIVSPETGNVMPPERLNSFENDYLKDWLPPEQGKAWGEMERAAYWRNLERAAESFGPRMIAILMEAGLLEPTQDPVEALLNVLKNRRF